MALRDKEAHRAYCRAYYYAHDGKTRKRRPRGAKLTPEERRERKRLRSIEYRKRNKEKIQAYRKSAKRKAAQSEYMRKWRAAHPEYQRAYYATHREAFREYQCAWLERRGIKRGVRIVLTDMERVKRRRAWNREYRKRNREKLLETARKWKAANREKVRAYSRRSYLRRVIREMFDAEYYAHNRARTRANHYARWKRMGLTWGQGGGRPSMRIPDYCVRGQVLDVRSQWLINNMTDEQRAYARELAIERKKQRERIA